MLRVVRVVHDSGIVVGVGVRGADCGVLRGELSSSCEASSSASDESAAHFFIGESAGLNGRHDVDVVSDARAGGDRLIVMEEDGGESGHTLLTVLPQLIKSTGAAVAHFDVHEVHEPLESMGAAMAHCVVGEVVLPGCGGDGDRLSSLLLLNTAARASSHVGIIALVLVVGGVSGLVANVVGWIFVGCRVGGGCCESGGVVGNDMGVLSVGLGYILFNAAAVVGRMCRARMFDCRKSAASRPEP